MAGNALELAVAYVSIVPATNAVAPAIVKEVAKAEGAVAASGKKAGAGYAAGMGGALGGAAKKVFAPLAAAAATVGVAQFFGDAIKGASDLEQSVGAVEAVFKSQASAIKSASNEAAANLGMTKSEYNDLAATLGSLLKNKGIKDFTGQTQNLIGLGADLAAQFGGSSKQAVEALASAMRGETDPIEQYGVSLSEASIAAEGAAMGFGKPIKNLDEIRIKQQKAVIAQRAYNEAVAKHGKNSDEALAAESRLMGAQASLAKAMEGKNQKLTEQEKAMAALSLIQKQTSDAQGAAAREQDTYAGRLARLTAAWENFKAVIGGPLIAVLATLMGGLTGVVNAAKDMFEGVAGGTDKVGLLSKAFGALAGSPLGQWFAELGRSIGAVLGPALSDVGTMLTGTLWPALKSLGGVLAGAAKAFGGFVAAIVQSPLVSFLTTILKGALVGFVQGVADIFKGLVRVVSGAFEAIAGLLTGDWSRMWSGLGNVVVGALQALWGFLQAGLMGRVLGVFRGFGQILGQIFTRTGPIGNAFAGFGSFALGVIEGIAKGFVEFGGTLGRIAGSVIGPAVRAVGAVFGALKGLADTAIKGAVGAFTSLGAQIKTALGLTDAAMQAFGRGVQAVWSAVTGRITGAWDAIFGRVLTPMRTTIAGVLLAAWNGFRDMISSVWASITATISAAWLKVTAVFTAMRTWVVATLTAAWNAFKALVASVWSGITTSISSAWQAVLSRVFTPLRTWVATTLTGAWNAFKALVAAVWTAQVASISNAWTRFLAIFTTLRTWVASTLTGMWNTFRALVASVWTAQVTSISNAWTRILGVFTTLRTWVTSTLTSAWNTLKTNAANAWTAITTSVGNAWTKISGYFTNLKTGVNQVWDFFGKAVTGISKAWSGLTTAIQGPINSAKSWINTNLVGKMNTALKAVGVSFTVPGLATGGIWNGPGKVTRAASGAVLPGYTPGRDPHRFWSPTGGRLALSGGEAVMVPEWTRAVGPRLVKLMNSIARRGGVDAIRKFLWGNPGGKPSTAFARGGVYRKPRQNAFADGGMFEALKGEAGKLLTAATGRLEGLASNAADVFADPAGAITKLGSSVLNLLPGRDSFPGALVFGAMGKLVSGVAGKVKDLFADMMTGGGFSKSGSWPPRVMGRVSPNTAAAVAFVRSAFGIGNIGTLGARKNASDHPWGKALDAMIPGWGNASGIGLGNRVASWFVANPSKFGTKYVIWREQINKGAGWKRYTHPLGLRDKTSLHYDHVHVSLLKRGGIFGGAAPGRSGEGVRPKLFDGGGLLRRGDVAVHDAVKPDRVLTDAQWQAVMRHLPIPAYRAGGWAASQGGDAAGVHIHGDVYGDPERFARKVTTRLRDELALVELAGV